MLPVSRGASRFSIAALKVGRVVDLRADPVGRAISRHVRKADSRDRVLRGSLPGRIRAVRVPSILRVLASPVQDPADLAVREHVLGLARVLALVRVREDLERVLAVRRLRARRRALLGRQVRLVDEAVNSSIPRPKKAR